ncbi:DUF1800 family protein [Nocardioides sp. dk4132]|nr:DUF1800 family protein [Nocardioides sp. dk4132]QGA06927.1 DUF1800 family protein [Nocardioides sp. dk884]
MATRAQTSATGGGGAWTGSVDVVRVVKPAVPSASTLHALSRFTYGWTPALGQEITKAGGFGRWFEAQLAAGADDSFTRSSAAWWTSVNASPAVLWRRHESEVETLWQADANYQRWVLARRIHSPLQVREVMTELWEHHFHVTSEGSGSALFRADYGNQIRAGSLGRFADLLHAAVTHPALGVYLDNAASTAKAPNENLGRELLELHTVGVGAYTEDDVKDSARILTGYRVDTWNTWKVSYDPASHAVGRVRVLGFTDANASSDGRATTRRYLDYLARHPRTAETVARKLATRFVADAPPAALVRRLAGVYLAHDTAIVPVLRALLASPEFTAARGTKVRTPSDDVVATYRALGVRIGRPRHEKSTANEILWQCGRLGSYPFAWPRPDGLPDQASAWATAPRFLASLDVHYLMCGAWWPNRDATYRTPASWLPVTAKRPSVRFDHLVDHLARTLTGRPASSKVQRVARQATGCRATERVSRTHPLVKWNMHRLLTVFLDSPTHMSR